jgi:hypothetical protein
VIVLGQKSIFINNIIKPIIKEQQTFSISHVRLDFLDLAEQLVIVAPDGFGL